MKTWTNHGQNGDFPSVSIERSYKDGEEWKTQKVTNLSADSLLSAARALERAHDAIMDRHRGAQGSRPHASRIALASVAVEERPAERATAP